MSRRRSRRLSCGPSLSMTRNPSLLSPDECPEILLVVISRHHLLEVLQLGSVHRPVPLQLVLALVCTHTLTSDTLNFNIDTEESRYYPLEYNTQAKRGGFPKTVEL